MAPEAIDLTIEGDPDEEVQIWYRGDRDRDPDDGDPAPIIYTGKLGPDGRLTVKVPHAYLVVGRPIRRGGLPLEQFIEGETTRTVRLPPLTNGSA